ncbi:hypothetical protein AWM79_20365 [Pseudomonas agarici]|uniref:DUF2946 domain-containing protein n=1 Tax=Pseudomonas agarici TaxID=46677 RepID=A0A0X1T638_PSEAA|nr:hypothetical protein AWM79_20365 [Pseudomonas agarici]SEK85730.1 hypothetical protein SAMN05216604_107167 [Pseudomonas agarici]
MATARRGDRILIKLLMVLILYLGVAHGGPRELSAEPASSSVSCLVMQGVQAGVDMQVDNVCPHMDHQMSCSISCTASYLGAVTNIVDPASGLTSPQHDYYAFLLGRMAVAPDPFPPKQSVLSTI